ncbi:MAG: hypothetical protein IKS67_15995 [Victivallales bacterium]|nr:hypothetical protein [Victivallales bacterium]
MMISLFDTCQVSKIAHWQWTILEKDQLVTCQVIKIVRWQRTNYQTKTLHDIPKPYQTLAPIIEGVRRVLAENASSEQKPSKSTKK